MKRIYPLICYALLCSFCIGWSQNQADFYDIKTIQEVSVRFEQPNWRDMLDSLRFNGDGTLPGVVTLNGNKYENARIRYRNARAFQIGGKHNSLYIQLPEGQTYQGYATIELSNALRDPSMVREVLAYEIARSYMPAPKANYAKVMINGSYYGFFINIEPVGETFLQRHFGNSDGELYQAETSTRQPLPAGCNAKAFASLQYDGNEACYTYAFDRKNTRDWSSLVRLTRVLNEEPESVERTLHIDRTLWMLAFNNVLVNLSSYSGYPSSNYFLYKNTDGQFTPILGDLNFAFGSYKNTDGSSDLDLQGLITLDPLLHANNPERPLISNLLKDELHRKRYLAHVRTILQDHFAKGQYEKRARELQDLIRKIWVEDPNKEYNLVDFSQSISATVGRRSRIPGIAELMKPRAEYLRQHQDLVVLPPAISNVTTLPREKYSPEQVTDFKIQAKVGQFARKVWLYYRFSDSEPFRMMTMEDDGNNHDGEAGDEVFGAVVQPAAGARDIQFYIVAENARSMSYSPTRYMYEQYRANLDELNK